jgi:hypothetical protein
MAVVNAETLKVNVTTVISIVLASFSLYFFIGGIIDNALIEAKIYAISLDIDRDQEAADMYKFKIENNIASPNDPSRMESLKDKISRRKDERSELLRML